MNRGGVFGFVLVLLWYADCCCFPFPSFKMVRQVGGGEVMMHMSFSFRWPVG